MGKPVFLQKRVLGSVILLLATILIGAGGFIFFQKLKDNPESPSKAQPAKKGIQKSQADPFKILEDEKLQNFRQFLAEWPPRTPPKGRKNPFMPF